jgi:flavin-dependent dehydrogenase
VGDAAAFIDPFTGSGIALALESSKLAADAIVSYSDFEKIAAEYRRTSHAAFDRRLKISRLLRLASRAPWLAGGAIAAIGSNKHLTKYFAKATRFSALDRAR